MYNIESSMNKMCGSNDMYNVKASTNLSSVKEVIKIWDTLSQCRLCTTMQGLCLKGRAQQTSPSSQKIGLDTARGRPGGTN
jgi:hypothetical protein